MPTLELRGVALNYPNGGVGLLPTTLTVAAGERLSLLGPTGSGKSTLLRLIVGLETPTSGDILLDGVRINDVLPHRRGIALLPQKPAFYPHLTVAENLKLSFESTTSAFEQAVTTFKLEKLLPRRPHQLSGGQKQQAALARLFLRPAHTLLLDEPFTALDADLRFEFRRELHLMFEALDRTIMIVSHDPIDALALGRRFGVLGDGRVNFLGNADEFRRQYPGLADLASAPGQFFFGRPGS